MRALLFIRDRRAQMNVAITLAVGVTLVKAGKTVTRLASLSRCQSRLQLIPTVILPQCLTTRRFLSVRFIIARPSHAVRLSLGFYFLSKLSFRQTWIVSLTRLDKSLGGLLWSCTDHFTSVR